jgi:hypothetical protein
MERPGTHVYNAIVEIAGPFGEHALPFVRRKTRLSVRCVYVRESEGQAHRGSISVLLTSAVEVPASSALDHHVGKTPPVHSDNKRRMTLATA